MEKPQGSFNYEVHVKELNERFARLIKQLGSNNKKGSLRHAFETDFAYAVSEIKECPRYLQGKMFDAASGIVNSLITHLRTQREKADKVAA